MAHPKQERAFLMVKPDGVQRGLIGEVVRRLEQRGLKVVALRMVRVTREQVDGFYPREQAWINRLGEKTLATYQKYGYDAMAELGTDKIEEIGAMVRGWLLDFMIGSPVVKMVVEGPHAVDMVRKIAGNTMPAFADPGTIRGDFSIESPAVANKDRRAVHNIVHASETLDEAAHEISYWFIDAELHQYERADESVMF